MAGRLHSYFIEGTFINFSLNLRSLLKDKNDIY